MTQLWAWEYEGKTEYGTKDSSIWPLWIMNHEPDEKGNTRFRRPLNEITDLRRWIMGSRWKRVAN